MPRPPNARPSHSLSRMWAWSWAVLSRKGSRTAPRVVVHDPAASGPHDLDDPYHDSTIQSRFGDLIARAARKEPR
jgi:hypothetical protein